MIGQKVLIHPSSSIKFGGRWGVVVEINKNDMLPLRIKFDDLPIPYRFDYNEVLTEEEVKKFFNEPVYCPQCGQDISNQYGICEDCLEGF